MALFSVTCLLSKLQADTYPKSHGMSDSKYGNIPSPERFKVICHANFSTPAMGKKIEDILHGCPEIEKFSLSFKIFHK